MVPVSPRIYSAIRPVVSSSLRGPDGWAGGGTGGLFDAGDCAAGTARAGGCRHSVRSGGQPYYSLPEPCEYSQSRAGATEQRAETDEPDPGTQWDGQARGAPEHAAVPLCTQRHPSPYRWSH